MSKNLLILKLIGIEFQINLMINIHHKSLRINFTYYLSIIKILIYHKKTSYNN